MKAKEFVNLATTVMLTFCLGIAVLFIVVGIYLGVTDTPTVWLNDIDETKVCSECGMPLSIDARLVSSVVLMLIGCIILLSLMVPEKIASLYRWARRKK